MITKNEDGNYTITCDADDCGAEFSGTDEFKETLALARAEMWKIIKGEIDFLHFCPDCVKKGRI